MENPTLAAIPTHNLSHLSLEVICGSCPLSAPEPFPGESHLSTTIALEAAWREAIQEIHNTIDRTDPPRFPSFEPPKFSRAYIKRMSLVDGPIDVPQIDPEQELLVDFLCAVYGGRKARNKFLATKIQ